MLLGKRLYFSSAILRPLVLMALFRPDTFTGWNCLHVAACIALSASQRAVGGSGRFRPRNLSHQNTPPSAGAPLHLAHRCCLARSRPHHAAAWQRDGGQGIRAEAWRLDRRSAQTAAGGGAIRARQRGAAA